MITPSPDSVLQTFAVFHLCFSISATGGHFVVPGSRSAVFPNSEFSALQKQAELELRSAVAIVSGELKQSIHFTITFQKQRQPEMRFNIAKFDTRTITSYCLLIGSIDTEAILKGITQEDSEGFS
jgi:hypothetical protein